MAITLAKHAKDLTGRRFGRLVVVEPAKRDGCKKILWSCQCDCGKRALVQGSNLTGGNSSSCGCLRDERRPTFNRKHGMSQTPENKAWRHMLARCRTPSSREYRYYGARGIEVRFSSFSDFYAHIGPRPSHAHSVDRIDVNGHYEPGNVRWATDLEQSRNRRNVIHITARGETKTIGEWAEVSGIKRHTIYNRIFIQGLLPEAALSKPVASA